MPFSSPPFRAEGRTCCQRRMTFGKKIGRIAASGWSCGSLIAAKTAAPVSR